MDIASLKGTSHPDYESVKLKIEELKGSIEQSEKQFKEHITIRSLMPSIGLVFPHNEFSGLVLDDASVDYVARARHELSEAKSHKAKLEVEQSKRSHTMDDTYKIKIAKTKAHFRNRETLIKAGPTFKYHFFCAFGNVIDVIALSSFLFAVFSSANTLEIWELITNYEDATINANLKDLFHLQLEPVDLQNMAAAKPPVKRLLCTDDMVSPDGAKLAEMEKLLDKEDLDLYKKHAAKIKNRCKAFLGCKNGNAAVIDIVWDYDPTKKESSFDMKILAQVQRLSFMSIIHGLYYQLNDDQPLIVTEICHSSGEHFLKAFSTNLELEWLVPFDILRLVSGDRHQRMVPQDKMQHSKKTALHGEIEYQAFITSFCVDHFHKGILVALKHLGSVLRITYDREDSMYSGSLQPELSGLAQQFGGSSDSLDGMSASEQPSAIINAKTIKVAWVCQLFNEKQVVTSTDSDTSGTSVSHRSHMTAEMKRASSFKAASAIKPSMLNLTESNPKNTISSGNPYKLSDPLPTITGLQSCVSRKTNKPCIIVACSDGMFRVCLNENPKMLVVMDTIQTETDIRSEDYVASDIPKDQSVDKGFRMHMELVQLKRGNLLLAFSPNATLIALDPEDYNDLRIDTHILSCCREGEKLPDLETPTNVLVPGPKDLARVKQQQSKKDVKENKSKKASNTGNVEKADKARDGGLLQIKHQGSGRSTPDSSTSRSRSSSNAKDRCDRDNVVSGVRYKIRAIDDELALGVAVYGREWSVTSFKGLDANDT
eukprot:jgi/Hompol1/5396/HPOL_004384-RA